MTESCAVSFQGITGPELLSVTSQAVEASKVKPIKVEFFAKRERGYTIVLVSRSVVDVYLRKQKLLNVQGRLAL